ncbi:MAG TPA: hypothetical protein DEP24_06730 [Mycobacterium sp.]|nr:hypothetical protein [Mycobacterium sp.]
MPAAIRSLFTASVAVASAGVIAVSPLAPAPAVPIPTVQIPGIELVNGASVPALGAIPYQILVNLLGDALALAPIVIGGIQQCTVCVGPVSPPSPAASPFTGWGALGLGVGLLTSPFATIGALQAGQSITQALGVGLLAVQTPIINTAALFEAPRQPFGGYEFEVTRARAAQAVVEAVVGAFGVTREILTGVRTIIAGSLAGVTAFAQTLATTGDFVAAFNAGLAPFTAGIQTALGNTVGAIQDLRTAVYADLTGGPGAATSPIPIVSAASAATAASAASAAPAASADMPRSVAAARAIATAAPLAGGGNDSPGNDSPGDDSPGAEAASGDSGRAAAKPSRARSAEARSTGARSTGARATS